jgi:hypothetical protein
MPGTIKVLLMAADPRQESGGLRIDHEIRGALEATRMGRASSELEIVTELAVRGRDLASALLRHNPQIVHFAGHGAGDQGIVLDGRERVRPEELAGLLTSFNGVRVVVLNACETLPAAEALSEVVDYTVAMETGIYDDAAVDFSSVFYAALAFGRPVPFAFDLARNTMRERFGRNQTIPRLLVRTGAGEGPLEGRGAPESPHAARGEQLNELKAVEVDRSAEVTNKVAGKAERPVSQKNSLNGVTLRGSLKMGNEQT